MLWPATQPRFNRLLALLSLCLFFGPSASLGARDNGSGAFNPLEQQAAPGGSPQEALLRAEFLKLKDKFEKEAKKTREQNVVSTLAVETTAQSWALAASFLEDEENDWPVKMADFKKSLSSKNWETRELAALEYYYGNLVAMTRKIALSNNQPPLLAELDAITEKTQAQFNGLEGKPDAALEKRVILSGALVSVVSVAVKSIGGGAMEQPIQLIVKDVLAKANSISDRADIHYRAKLALLYANNVQGLTSLVFLLGHNAGPPLSTELATVYSSWNKHSQDASLPDLMSLAWTAQCQATLPLAYWLATH